MKARSYYLLILSLLGFFSFPSEAEKHVLTRTESVDRTKDTTQEIVFRDTSGWLVFDSVMNNLGTFSIDTFGNRMTKHFKYIGPEPGIIVKAFTSDPHFICNYPKEPLQHGNIYTLTICFSWRGRTGYPMRKSMGFVFSDDSRSTITIQGTPLEPSED